MSKRTQATARALLERCGRTYAAEAGIRLRDAPAPLYQLLVLAHLLSARISADIAVAAARALFDAGMRTPRRMAEASWQQRVDALGVGGYRRTSLITTFAAAFPMDKPRFVIVSMLDEPQGTQATSGQRTAAWNAAPVIARAGSPSPQIASVGTPPGSAVA